MKKHKILIVDDEQSLVYVLKKLLEDEFVIETASDGEEALSYIKNNRYFAIFLDIRIPKINGMEVLAYTRKLDDKPNVIIMTAQNTMVNAIDAMKKGAYDYITKPFELDEILGIIEKIKKNDGLTDKKFEKSEDFLDTLLVGKSKIMQEVFKTIGKLSHNNITVLILGESGTGKELIARAIHLNSVRSDKPFIVVNTPSIPSELLESELFGHEKGSYTGANEKKEGKFISANGGTIFLDEIGDMPLNLQAKLLRAIQEKEIEPVGSNKPVKIDVRIIAATNKNLKSMVKNAKFREDLYYRLNVIEITLPPLRERKSDIPILADFFIKKFSQELNMPEKQLGSDALSLLQSYNFPGNIRELENAIRRCMVMSPSAVLNSDDFIEILNNGENNLKDKKTEIDPFEDIIKRKIKNYIEKVKDTEINDVYKSIMGLTEKIIIEEILNLYNFNQLKVSKLLGINRNTLRKKVNEYKINIKKQI
ncbi:MAG: sigma-54-dependent Fis family transcriptional regulator [Candidatus Acidulodesulfobacterium acidiphilum]|uniref:DNA-binding transcriptional regulator NtrC n=1 Tax=Candidatus Acidulodesulfobacterium acidiphilum TaxID=2597224 RepID=A0A520X686_9DELT|nr:MAG: sigma-54-dependent Fis family transcriptional regulator [Candidatus Acidulodesulfobacterium acidiphilum]